MTHLSRYLTYEFRRFKGLSRLALIFILLIPLLYGGIYLHANWDLYAHIDNIKVAVVNKDKPATFDDKTISAGEEFEAALRSNPVFDWQFLGTDQTRAEEGLTAGEYFMVVTVPENFSSNLVSAGAFDPKRATITLHRDDANGFIIGTLTGKADDTLSKTLDSTVSAAYFNALFTNLDTIKSGMQAAADGSAELDSGLSQVKNGVHQLNEAVTDIDTGSMQGEIDRLNSGLSALDSAATGVSDAGRSFRAAGRELAGVGPTVNLGASNIKNSLAPIKNYFDTTLPDLQDKAVSLANIDIDLLTGADGGLIANSHKHLSASRDLVVKLRQNPALAEDPDFLASIEKEIAASLESQSAVTTKLAGHAKLSADLSVGLDPTLLASSANAVNAASSTLTDSAAALDRAGKNLNEGLDAIDGTSAEVNSALSDVRSASSAFLSKAPQLVSGVLQLSDALGRLDTAVPQLSDGAHELATKLADGVQQLPDLSEDERTNLATIMSSPVDVEQVVTHDAQTYGRGLAPMFFSIALWIAAVSTFLVVRTISGRALSSRARPARLAFFGFGPVGAIALIGGLIMGLGVWALLGLDPVHPILYLLLIAVTSLSFMALGYWIRLLLGSPQTALFLVLLILQLPASGGTFPPQMLGPFYQFIAKISPMKYSVDAFRVAISGGAMSTYWLSLGILAAILAGSLVITWYLVKKRQIFRMRDLHPPMVTSTSTADYAFSVRPR
ncbi:YhgE/Pip family protein [Bowdeniella massiliensis]|uniref:YhgE/Pip family protein n=1 Tax=Bowdeniella massiliensis TaxID=2932264 RepID=UPI0020285AC8|nr:YhgE/Pip domain-containing protein [Bowdeniella massiliensis]